MLVDLDMDAVPLWLRSSSLQHIKGFQVKGSYTVQPAVQQRVQGLELIIKVACSTAECSDTHAQAMQHQAETIPQGVF